MNETYEWLYDNYALPLMQVEKEADKIKQSIVSLSRTENTLPLRDQLEDLCMLWGTDAFSLGLQLGLRLMAGQRAGGLSII
nr:hypothetical protein [uncultured Oscillibacter sp.]